MSTQPTSSDVTLCYFGGSGGFFCLYLLLLTNQFKCFFEDGTHSAYDTRSSHWDIQSVPQWKDSEVWPDNSRTFMANFDVSKVFFLCNPLLLTREPGPHPDILSKFPGKKILLYTDLDTHWHLAKTKRAYWFQQGRSLNGHGPVWQTPEYREEQVTIWYNNVKKDTWPDISVADDFYNLPQEIQDECVIQHDMWEVLDIGKFDNEGYTPRGVMYNGDLVYKKVVDIMPRMDIVIKLQDLIKTQGRVLFDQLGISTNTEIQKFLIHYLSLHTAEQRNFLLNKHV
jgi:hypothetical protein